MTRFEGRGFEGLGMLRHVDEHELLANPLDQLAAWLREAEGRSPQPNAMTLATTSASGRPSARQVLLRGLDERGLVFFTNRTSRKALELAANPYAALVLYWVELNRQVRVEGAVEDVDEVESQTYWRTRPRGSQIAAWASPQSQLLPDRRALEALYDAAEKELGEGDIPLPRFWGGYRVRPESVEVWQQGENRLHDRILYRRTADGWSRERLAP